MEKIPLDIIASVIVHEDIHSEEIAKGIAASVISELSDNGWVIDRRARKV